VTLLSSNGHVISKWPTSQGDVQSIAWSPDGTTLATSGSDRTLKVWSIEGELLRSVQGQVSTPSCVSWDPKGNQLAASGHDGAIRFYDTVGDSTDVLPRHNRAAWSVAWSTDGRSLASIGDDGALHVWRRRDAEPQKTFAFSGSQVTWLDDELAVVDDSGKLIILSLRDNDDAPTVVDAHEGRANGVSWNPAQRLIATVGVDRVAKIFSASGQEASVLTGHTNRLYAAAWSHDGQWLATGGETNCVQLWSADGAQGPTSTPHHHIASLAWHPDDQRIAVAYVDSTVHLLGVDGQTKGSFVPNFGGTGGNVGRSGATSVSWSANGQLAVGTGNNTISSWNPDTLEPHWLAVCVTDEASVTFTGAGQIIDGAPEIVERELIYLVETDDGRLEVLKPSEFQKRIGESIRYQSVNKREE